MKIFIDTSQNLPFLRIAAVVSLLHATLIIFLIFNAPARETSAPRPRLIARTIDLEKKTSLPTTSSKSSNPSKPKESKPRSSSKKEIAPSKPQKISPAAKVQPAKKSPPPAKKNETAVKKQAPPAQKTAIVEKGDSQNKKKQELLKNAQAQLAKVKKNTPSPPTLAERTTPSIDKLHLNAVPLGNSKGETVQQTKYQDELASRLKLLLKLPEEGDVKLKLTLESSGKVSKVEILSSQSEMNRKYVSEKMPTLSFAPFGNDFGSTSSYAFVIVLKSDP